MNQFLDEGDVTPNLESAVILLSLRKLEGINIFRPDMFLANDAYKKQLLFKCVTLI